MKIPSFTNLQPDAKKHETNELPFPSKTKTILGAAGGWILAGLIGCAAWSASAAVQITRCDPPLAVNAYTDAPEGLFWNTFAPDFNADGESEFRLVYFSGDMGAYFDSPTRFGRHVPPSGITRGGGDFAAVPLGSTIGSDIVSAIATNYYVWSLGDTNTDDLTQPLGDHHAGVISANYTTGGQFYPITTISTGGILITTNNYGVTYGVISGVTNINYGWPVVSGDMAGKEGVIALEFYINGQIHYGYVHFDFRNVAGGISAGGVIYGWAYETEPGKPITVASLAPDTETHDRQHPHPLVRNPQHGR
jgi:hypothetical protein